jgi:hypothetical protein
VRGPVEAAVAAALGAAPAVEQRDVHGELVTK